MSFDADVAVVGAGPIGLEIAGACSRLGISALVFDGGQVAQTIYDWPEETRYFSSPERMAVAGIPMQSTHQQLGSREEYLAYLRSVVEILGSERPRLRAGHRGGAGRHAPGTPGTPAASPSARSAPSFPRAARPTECARSWLQPGTWRSRTASTSRARICPT